MRNQLRMYKRVGGWGHSRLAIARLFFSSSYGSSVWPFGVLLCCFTLKGRKETSSRPYLVVRDKFDGLGGLLLEGESTPNRFILPRISQSLWGNGVSRV